MIVGRHFWFRLGRSRPLAPALDLILELLHLELELLRSLQELLVLLLHPAQTHHVALHVANLETELLGGARVLVTARGGGRLPAQTREFALLLLDNLLERLDDILELLHPPRVTAGGVLAAPGGTLAAARRALGEVLEEPVDAALEPIRSRRRLLSLESQRERRVVASEHLALEASDSLGEFRGFGGGVPRGGGGGNLRLAGGCQLALEPRDLGSLLHVHGALKRRHLAV